MSIFIREDIVRGDIVKVNFGPTMGSASSKIRPCLVVQNDTINANSPTTIIVVITSREGKVKKKYPTHVWINKGEGNLILDSIAQCEQIRTIDKRRIIQKVGHLNDDFMKKVEEAIKIALSIEDGSIY